MLIVDLSLARVVQHSPFQFYALPTFELSLRSMVAYAPVHDDHYLTHSKFNSLLTEMITPQTYKNIYIIYIHIKPLPVSHIFGARSGSPRTTEPQIVVMVSANVYMLCQLACLPLVHLHQGAVVHVGGD